MVSQLVDFENSPPRQMETSVPIKKPMIKDPKERFSTCSHFVGAIISVVLTVIYLVITDESRIGRWTILVFGLSNIILFSSSTIVHSQGIGKGGVSLWSKLDFIAIFILIAGSYTAVLSIFLEGPWKLGLIFAQWGFASVGIVLRISKIITPTWVNGLIYLFQGWMLVIAGKPLINSLPKADLILIIIEAVVFTAGAVIYIIEKPRLWPGKFGSHDLWHILVLIGTFMNFIIIGRVI